LNPLTTLYVDRKDIAVKASRGVLQFHEPDGRRGSVPVAPLERVVVRGRASLDSSAIAALAEAGAGILVLSGRKSQRVGIFVGKPHNDVLRRLGQFDAYRDESARRAWSAALVTAKIRAQVNALRKMLVERPDKRRAITRATTHLEAVRDRVETPPDPPPLATLLGLEGASAASYFRCFAELVPKGFGFAGRRRRPPTDGVNACLSLGYTLLHFEAVCACHEAGLDPLLGLFHEPSFGRESLASDVIEPFRAHVDVWVWNLLRKRILTPASFSADRGAVLLGKAGRQRFYQNFTPLARGLRRLLRRQLQRAARDFADRARTSGSPLPDRSMCVPSTGRRIGRDSEAGDAT